MLNSQSKGWGQFASLAQCILWWYSFWCCERYLNHALTCIKRHYFSKLNKVFLCQCFKSRTINRIKDCVICTIRNLVGLNEQFYRSLFLKSFSLNLWFEFLNLNSEFPHMDWGLSSAVDWPPRWQTNCLAISTLALCLGRLYHACHEAHVFIYLLAKYSFTYVPQFSIGLHFCDAFIQETW